MQVVALPKLVPVTLSDYSGEKFSDAEYLAFCRANPDLRLERTAEGEILIVPPAGSESSFRNSKLTAQLDRWAEADGRGNAFDSSGQFFLPDGSALLQTPHGYRMLACAAYRGRSEKNFFTFVRNSWWK